ncbi:MAG TPA: hypothetical protein PLA50_02680, partial [Bacteroidia bacterium]|nr:hypothetical protein [Bacteroidia bacterium]
GPLREGEPEGGGGGSTKTDDDPKLTIGQRLSAALASKTTLQAEIAKRDAKITEHETTIATLTEERDSARTELATATARITDLEAQAAEVETALKAAEVEAAGLKTKETTVEKKAQEKVASLGFSASKLPAAQDGGEDDLESLRAQVGQTTDPVEKANLVARIRKLRDAN